MPSPDLQERLSAVQQRLATVYDGIGHNSGRPYLYFVYAPGDELIVRRLADDMLVEGNDVTYLHIDLLPLTIESLAGHEAKRAELLNDPVKGQGADKSIVRRWALALQKAITARLAETDGSRRPVVVLRGLGALHPLGNPTELMEAVAEKELRDPRTDKIVPILLLVPGSHLPQVSRTYQFLGLAEQTLTFYRGEEL
ncbi:MAG: hypothetical protein KDE24_22350 [Caldilinea sp.]|nr:hypothetical protein [Caldilinea sp.]